MFARDTLRDLLEKFARSGSPNPAAPHAYASYAVSADMKQALGGKDPLATDPDTIRAQAKRLLARHTEQLLERGAASIRGIIEERFANDPAAAAR